jgi:hypothetical protein
LFSDTVSIAILSKANALGDNELKTEEAKQIAAGKTGKSLL